MKQLAINSTGNTRGTQGAAMKPTQTINTLSNAEFASMFAAACARRASVRTGGQ